MNATTTGSSRRPKLRRLKPALLVLVALGVVSSLAVAFRPRPVAVDLGEVVLGPLRVTVDEEGRSRVRDRYVVSAPVSGVVERTMHHPGDEVKQGEIVARIAAALPGLLDERTRSSAEARIAGAEAGARRARAEVSRAAADAELAHAEAERNRALFRQGDVSAAEREASEIRERTTRAHLLSVRFGVQVAAHELEMAQAALKMMTEKRGPGAQGFEVPAPLAGRVLAVKRESEGMVQAGEPLLELGDPGALELVVDVLTSDAIRIRPGAEVLVDRWGGEPLEGRVRLVEPSAFTRPSALGVEEQRVNVLVDLSSPRERWSTLGDGFRIEAHIVVWEAHEVLKVPASAVFRHGGSWAVFVVDDGVVHEVAVELGERTGREVQVVSGLQAGQRVVLHPSDRILSGAEVEQR